MNQHSYRIVFNKHRGQRTAVAETACSQRKSGSGAAVVAKTLSSIISAALLSQFLLLPGAALAQIVADPSAPRNQQPTILSTSNGVPQINIQTPSAGGVSRNTYSQFDVGSSGAILNNARTNSQTTLGGWVQANPWLARGPAKVILNEVNSNNPSKLKGFVEVAGQRAEVIIANPSGIAVNAGGFINASSVVLTTGTAAMSNGNLDQFLVRRGVVQIDGAGLDTRDADYTAILSRAAQVNAGI